MSYYMIIYLNLKTKKNIIKIKNKKIKKLHPVRARVHHQLCEKVENIITVKK
jgi:hypothetical protein